MTKEGSEKVCDDCHLPKQTLNIRNRSLCSDCFVRYVNSKALKRMESYRIKNDSNNDQRRRILIPISGGISSMVLLQILDTQLQKQLSKQNRRAYDLVVANVVIPGDHASEASLGWYGEVSNQFPLHTYLPSLTLDRVFEHDLAMEDDLKAIGIQRVNGETDMAFLNRIVLCTTTLTAKSDFHLILIQRFIVALGKRYDCESVLWGHSDSRLAAEVLAEVAKGRGGSIPSSMADGPSPYSIGFNYPLRDLYQSEIELYASILPNKLPVLPEDSSSRTAHLTSIRNSSIDKLLSNYIHSQAEKYPSIVANVVRTTGKLQSNSIEAHNSHCSLCKMPVETQNPKAGLLCYGCIRTRQDIKLVVHYEEESSR